MSELSTGALSRIEAAGFSASLIGENLAISPASNLTQTQKEFLKSHKAEIIAELKGKTLSVSDRQKLLDYMATIEETDQAMIDEFIDKCATDSKHLAWALVWANKAVPEKQQPDQQTVTCRNCAYFKSYNANGGGAGQCCIGAYSSGICHWSGTFLRCNHYSILTPRPGKATK